MRQSLTRKAIMLAACVLPCIATCLSQCPTTTTKGNDFWVTFLYNQNISHPTTTDELQIIATSDHPCTCYVRDTAGVITSHSIDNTSAYWQHTIGQNIMRIAEPFNGAYHVTSTEDIWLYARNLVNNTEDVTVVLPTAFLSCRYIVQDYPATQKGGEVAFVATADNTVLTMTVPCNILNTSITAGTTLTVNLNSGQTYLLMAADVSASFSGMVVESNNKPFAMFQGAWNPAVPTNGSGRDHMFEQAIPPECWGTDFIVAGVSQQTGNNRIRITSSENNCSISVGGSVLTTINANETYEYSINPSAVVQITTSKPSCVILYLGSYSSNGIGDPSSVTIPPIDKGVCESAIHLLPSDEITSQNIVIICPQAYDAGLRLNGNTLPTTNVSTIGSYKVHRINNLSLSNYTISNNMGPYVAYCYGVGPWISYAYLLGMTLNPIVYDTVTLYDTTCMYSPYNANGFSLSAAGNTLAGTLILERDETTINGHTHYILHLTVFPTFQQDVYDSIVYGDTLIWNGFTITTEGDYPAELFSQYGCDSTVTLHVSYTGFDTIFLFDTTCAGNPYNGHGFSFETSTNAGDTVVSRTTIEAGIPTLYLLQLTLLPNFTTDTSITIINGDTLFFDDTLLTVAGSYVFSHTAANGCDSVVILHVSYAEIRLVSSADGICPGEEVVLTASGTHTFIWSSMPDDPELDSQQGCNPIIVHPTVTTTYQLLDGAGNVVCSITVGTEPPPAICIETSRPFVDFDNPRVTFIDCSEGGHTSTWQFSDGITSRGNHVLRKFDYPLPDSIGITLTSCNRYNCCSDTTFKIPCRIRSLWFPNVFTPDSESNNLFRCFTSRNIIEFEIDIYNRWGLIIWSSTDIQQGWDGRRSDGTPCPQDAYVYRWHWRDADGDAKSGVGTVTLIR